MFKDNKQVNNKQVGCSVYTSTFLSVQIIFLVFKLTGILNWSWWCVLIPFFCPSIFIIIILFISMIRVIIKKLFKKK